MFAHLERVKQRKKKGFSRLSSAVWMGLLWFGHTYIYKNPKTIEEMPIKNVINGY